MRHLVGTLSFATFVAWAACGHATCSVSAPPAFTTSTSLATQNSAAVSVTGGCIDGVPIGQNTPAAVSATTLNGNTVPTGTGTVSINNGTVSANGLTARPLPILDFKNNDGTTLVVSASSGKFGLTSTPGTVLQLLTEAANSSTKADIAQAEYVVPAGYIAGQNITVTASCDYTLGGGTVGTHTLAAAAYLTANAGTQGSTLIATGAQTVAASAGDVTFVITGTTLVPGSHLILTFTLVIQDTGGSNITAHVNSVRMS